MYTLQYAISACSINLYAVIDEQRLFASFRIILRTNAMYNDRHVHSYGCLLPLFLYSMERNLNYLMI